MRKLVTIRQVSKILSIPNADFIELAKVDGWQCVVKKDEFKEGDYAVYHEIDSFCPMKKQYEFLHKSSYKKMLDEEGYRIKTSRFMKEFLSQGLLLPLKSFPELINAQLGDDVTDILKVKLYEPPIPSCISGMVKGAFPSYLIKSDQERLQGVLQYFDMYKDEEFEETEKLDGTSMTVYFKDNCFGVCGRNWELRETDNNSLWNMAKKLQIKNVLESIGKNVGIQGELIGENINGNKLKIKGHKFYIYDIVNIDKHCFMLPEERICFFNKMNEVNNCFLHVPILNDCVKIFKNNFDEILNRAHGKSILNLNLLREGLVFKNIRKPITFKIIDNMYLLKHGE